MKISTGLRFDTASDHLAQVGAEYATGRFAVTFNWKGEKNAEQRKLSSKIISAIFSGGEWREVKS